MKLLIPVLLLICFDGFAQPSDFLVLKKRNKSIQYFYAGTNIEFVSSSHSYRNGLITAIKNDSLYLQEFLVRRLPTVYGGYILDTAGSFRFAYHYAEIKSFGKKQKGFNVAGSGAALLGGGILLTFASGVAYLIDKDKFSPELLGAAAGLAVAGYFMSKAGSKGIVIGKKYRLEYIKMTK